MSLCSIWIKLAKIVPWYKNMAFCLCTHSMETNDKFTRAYKLETWPINYSFCLQFPYQTTTHYIMQFQLRGIIILIFHKQWNIAKTLHDLTKLHSRPPSLNGCRNLSLGLATKVRVCKVAGQEGSWESHDILSKVWEGVKEWTFTPQGSSTLGVGVSVHSWIFKGRLQGPKLNDLKNSLYQWKFLRTWISKMGSHRSFGHLKHKLRPKEGPGVKLVVWLPTTKSRESTQFPCV